MTIARKGVNNEIPYFERQQDEKVFDYNLTESVYQNLRDIMDGVVISGRRGQHAAGRTDTDDRDKRRGNGVKRPCAGIRHGMGVLDLYRHRRQRRRELIEITAKDYGENVLGESSLAT